LEGERDGKRAVYGLSPDDVALIFVGGICARKDPMFLIEQMPAILTFNPHAKLVIVGPVLEPDYHARMLSCIEQHGLKDRVIFTGEVRDPYPLFAISDIVVFASHLEGFGCAVTEGMAHGLPAVVRHLPGVNDLFIRDGETGFFFTSSEEYLVRIRPLIEHPSLRREMGTAARKLVADEFDNFKNAERIMGVYGFAPAGGKNG
jgi:glycosyltransferase involved in cell wall biosynthesis